MKSLSLFAATLLAIAGLFAVSGCTNQPANPPPQQSGASHHDHPADGPHSGHLIELGNDEFHAELVYDDVSEMITIYLLGADAKTPVFSADPELPLNLVVDGKPQQAKLAAKPQGGETAEKCSRYQLVDANVLKALVKDRIAGRLNVNINGQSYTGDVKLDDHAHDHDHK
jgi:hypothetical protein